MTQRPRPLALIILDGWGYREELDANAIAAAKKPFFDHLWQHYPHTLVSGSGRCVGLPPDQMGNSEVGHLNMGAGRVIEQDLTRIDRAIHDKTFFSNPVLVKAIVDAVKSQKAIHVLGLLSEGGVHSHEKHIHAIMELAKQHHATQVYFHVFLDGRDTPPKSARASIKAFPKTYKIASIIGRYYAMDRDKRWDRIEKAYHLLTLGDADYHAETPLEALQLAYARNESDEFVKATSITPVTIQEGDTVIFMNFRADRARLLTQAFIDPHFAGFHRRAWPKVNFVSLTEYDKNFPIPIAFSSEPLKNILGDYLSRHHFKQLRIAETEKYAHVTFFFNGGIEEPYPNEERILVPSPKVATYDLKPEMSAPEITDQLMKAIQSEHYDVIICNFANPDMLGHTGHFEATVQAIEIIDACLLKIIKALQSVGGEAIITADHGNAEIMYDPHTEQPHTAHTHELVPFIYVGRPATIVKKQGVLADIAPTMLYLMNLKQPLEMTGETLIKLT